MVMGVTVLLETGILEASEGLWDNFGTIVRRFSWVKFLQSILVLLLFSPAMPVTAEDSQGASTAFEAGLQHYEIEDYAAAETFADAVDKMPGMSEYHRQLGRAYGRLVEQAPLFMGGNVGEAKNLRVHVESSCAHTARSPDTTSDEVCADFGC